MFDTSHVNYFITFNNNRVLNIFDLFFMYFLKLASAVYFFPFVYVSD